MLASLEFFLEQGNAKKIHKIDENSLNWIIKYSSFLWLLFGCPTTNFMSLSRGQPHSLDVNHCVSTISTQRSLLNKISRKNVTYNDLKSHKKPQLPLSLEDTFWKKAIVEGAAKFQAFLGLIHWVSWSWKKWKNWIVKNWLNWLANVNLKILWKSK